MRWHGPRHIAAQQLRHLRVPDDIVALGKDAETGEGSEQPSDTSSEQLPSYRDGSQETHDNGFSRLS
jgi:hypothetical protein